MKKVLIIDATGRSEEYSRTKRLANKVIDKLKEDKGNSFEYVDLYALDIPYVTREVLESRRSGEYVTRDAVIGNDLMEQFNSADVYVFVYPIWNWSIPGILKSYFDLIMVPYKNFKVEGIKITGFLKGKEAILVSTSGGVLFNHFISSVVRHENPNLYVKKVLNVTGVKAVKTVSISNMNDGFKGSDGRFDLDKYNRKIEKVVSKI